MSQTASLLALDIGKVRIGVAIASWSQGFPRPLTTLGNDSSLADNLRTIIDNEEVKVIVAGYPRSLDGKQTGQSTYTLQTVKRLEELLDQKIELQDEAATSLKAEAELKARKRPYSKEDVDALSAVYILEDYLLEHPNQEGHEHTEA